MSMDTRKIKAASKKALLNRKRRTADFVLHLDEDAVTELEQARLDKGKAERRGADDDEMAVHEARVAEAEEAVRESTVKIVVGNIGRSKFDELVESHPNPKAEEDDQPEWDPETFPPALVAASIMEPELTRAEIEQLWEDWTVAELQGLFSLALMVNTQRRLVQLGN